MDLRAHIRNVPGFPKPGIVFKDITTLLQDGSRFQKVVDQLADRYRPKQVDAVVAVDARGFIVGSAVAYALKAGLIPIRKKGKLPWKTHCASYALEYGTDTLEIHQDAFTPGSRILIVDDLLATGGTAEAVVKLVRQLQGQIVGVAFMVELNFLKGRQKLESYGVDVLSLVEYDQE
ncbi:MAG: adenine phosphoribosyltransferase [Candidatus Omnitrophica bacterium]|nr:adenine phosphoribosyltransferase [Candidatus Omnitrophota bacterium]